MILTITNWQTRQTFRSKNPPWIKLHTSLLDNYAFQSMSVDAKHLLTMLWLFATESKDAEAGIIKITIDEICWRLHRNDPGTVGVAINECIRGNFITADQEINEDSNRLVTSGNRLVTDLLQTCDIVKQTETETELEPEPGKKTIRRKTKNGTEFHRVEQQVTDNLLQPVTDLLQTCVLETETETEKRKKEKEQKEKWKILYDLYPQVQIAKGSFPKFYEQVKTQLKKGVSYDDIKTGIECYEKYCTGRGIYNSAAWKWIRDEGWKNHYPTAVNTTEQLTGRKGKGEFSKKCALAEKIIQAI